MNISIDPILNNILKKQGVNAEVLDSILTKPEKQSMLENLEVFASNWFINNGKDVTIYREVSIGSALHDEFLSLFCMLYHILLIIEKLEYKKNKIVFYHSISNSFPDNIKIILLKLGVKVKKTNDRYPFLCYKKDFEYSSYSRKTYSGIVYDGYSKTRYLSTVRPRIKSFLYKFMFDVINRRHLNSNRIIYIRPMRRLYPMIDKLLKDNKKNNHFNLKLQFPKDNIPDFIYHQNFTNPLKLIKKLIKLSKKGILFKHSIYLFRVNNRLINVLSLNNIKEKQMKLIEESKISIRNLIQFNDEAISNIFIDELISFYFHHFNKFTTLIDKLYLEVKNNKIKNYLVEYINPFRAQVLANCNRNLFFIHLSRFLNNQYFCKQFIDKVKNNFFIIVSSEFEYERIIKQGFNNASVIKVCESYFDNQKIKRNKYEISNNKHFLENKTVLLITPPLGVLRTFRSLLDSTFFLNFITDIVTTLSKFNVSKIIIRQGTNNDEKINRLDYRMIDLYRYIINKIEKINSNIIFNDAKTKSNLQEDLHNSDLVIGTLSACAIDAALEGLDYINYDNSILPFPESTNHSIFSKGGPIPSLSNKNELNDYLLKYVPNYGENIIKFIGPYNKSNPKKNINYLDEIHSLGLI